MQDIFKQVEFSSFEPLDMSIGSLEAGTPANPVCGTNPADAISPVVIPPEEVTSKKAEEAKRNYHDLLLQMLQARKKGTKPGRATVRGRPETVQRHLSILCPG